MRVSAMPFLARNVGASGTDTRCNLKADSEPESNLAHIGNAAMLAAWSGVGGEAGPTRDGSKLVLSLNTACDCFIAFLWHDHVSLTGRGGS